MELKSMLESMANSLQELILSPDKEFFTQHQLCWVWGASDNNITVKTIQLNVPLLFKSSKNVLGQQKNMDAKQTSSVPHLCFQLFNLLFFLSFPSSLPPLDPPSFDLQTKEKKYGNFYLGKRKWRKGGHRLHKKSPGCRNGEKKEISETKWILGEGVRCREPQK